MLAICFLYIAARSRIGLSSDNTILTRLLTVAFKPVPSVSRSVGFREDNSEFKIQNEEIM
jgi:hypothetical protein